MQTAVIDIKKRVGKIIPSFAVIPLMALVFSNIAVYYGSRIINMILDRPYSDMTGVIDRITPVVPGFAVIYLIAFPFWYITYLLICRSDPDKCRATVIVNIGAKLFCGLLFIMFPTTNIRPQITGTGIPETLLGLIYSMDSPDNLFPSIHCLESVFCFLLIKDEPGVHKYIKQAAFILAASICLSTLFTKQHVLPDVMSGTAIALAAYLARRVLLSPGYACPDSILKSRAA